MVLEQPQCHFYCNLAGTKVFCMKNDENSMLEIPPEIREHLVPDYSGDVVYECIACGETYPIEQFLYTCPECKSLLRLNDRSFASLKKIDGRIWQRIFDYRKMINIESLKGIFLSFWLSKILQWHWN